MSKAKIVVIQVAAVTFLLFSAFNAGAYDRYNDGCQNCHGGFKSSVSPKGSIFPSGDKHEMHRKSSSMNADCDLCHTNGDNDDPYIGSSDGTNNNTGYGCVGCHGRLEDAGNDSLSAGLGAGLRQHHYNTGITSCALCHTDSNPVNYTPVGEHIMPVYFGTADTNADMPCNLGQTVNANENWTIGDFVGLDNDGDVMWDGNDSDCIAVIPTPGDLNFDGRADIVWRNSSTGQNWAYLMNGASISQSLRINTVPTAWQIAGTGDYDGDGDADVLWRNTSTGENWMYLMDGVLIDSSVRVVTVPTDWQVAGNGDYDGDGDADILWRNSVTGQNWMYLMNGAVVESSLVVVWDSVFTIPTVWQVAGNGDYNGDGKADILWRNSSTGENWIYFMSGAFVDNSVRVNIVPTTWQVAGNGDYDGDGDADILWRNSSTGQNWMYLMNGAVVESSVGVNTVPTGWQLVGDGDYNGDGNADILWRNSSTGQNWMYLMTGATIDSSVRVNTVSDTAWQIVNVD